MNANKLIKIGKKSKTTKPEIDTANTGFVTISYTEKAGGWVGITDKYWLAALLPTQTKGYNFGFQSLAGNGDRYQVDFIDPAGIILTKAGLFLVLTGPL